MSATIRSWRSLKSASITSAGNANMLKLVWVVESIVRVSNGPVIGGGDSGTSEKRRFTEEGEIIPFHAALLAAVESADDRLLTQEEVAEILKGAG